MLLLDTTQPRRRGRGGMMPKAQCRDAGVDRTAATVLSKYLNFSRNILTFEANRQTLSKYHNFFVVNSIISVVKRLTHYLLDASQNRLRQIEILLSAMSREGSIVSLNHSDKRRKVLLRHVQLVIELRKS